MHFSSSMYIILFEMVLFFLKENSPKRTSLNHFQQWIYFLVFIEVSETENEMFRVECEMRLNND